MHGHLDNIDIEILALLQKDSSVAVKDIAKAVGLSATPTYERIKHLENEGYIKQYTAILDRDKIGFDILVYCNVTLKEQSKTALLEFEMEIAKLNQIMEVIGLSGNYDYMLKIVVKDIHAYNDFILNTLSNIPNIGQFHSSIVLGEIKRDTAYPVQVLKS
jgi:Lrp/AsnC family leucine-responsive transcriptional regulator